MPRGCPLDCGYCVRHFWGNFEQKTPQLRVTTPEAVAMLTGHAAFRPHTTPVQLFNKATDPMLPGVKPHTFAVLEELDRRGMTNLVLIITRFHVTTEDMAALEALQHVRVSLLFTYSGIADARVEPIAKNRTTIRSIETATARNDRTKVILYWRPIVPGWNDDPETMAGVLEVADSAGVDALVFTGYYHQEENAEFLRASGVAVPYADNYQRRKMLPAELDAKVVRAWQVSGISVPLFRKTSCGVTYAHEIPDYNGHWGVPELCDICPAAQRRRCAADRRSPTEAEFRQAPADLDYGSDTPFLIEDGHVLTHALGEQRRYALQHRLRHQIREVDHPHLHAAHGRALEGYEPREAQRRRLSEARERLSVHARYDDD
ncbi:radical SAM protein [Streptomonospora alba]|uniref:radical SAM protein n=1 Tax=Streptomonospora alba TaxID=183763 RepID=UPI001EE7094A|nr:radical SAM protein [Streptomonospora alba]